MGAGTRIALRLWIAVSLSWAQAQQAPPAPSLPPALAEALAHHPYFAKAHYVVESTTPYLFLVQDPAQPDPTYVSRVAASTPPLLDPALEAFERYVLTPLALAPCAEPPTFVVAILAGPAEFAAYLKATGSPAHAGLIAAYDAALHAVVLHEVPSRSAQLLARRGPSARHALFHALEQAYGADPERGVTSDWLLEGLAAFLTQVPPEQKTALKPEPLALKEFVAECADADWGVVSVRPIEELLATGDSSHVDAFLRARGVTLQAANPARLARGFERQAALLVYYLHESDPKLRDNLRARLAQVFRAPGAAPIEDLPGQHDGAFDLAFGRWVIQAHGFAMPGEFIPDAALERLRTTARPMALVRTLEQTRAAVSMAGALPPDGLARALWDVRRGRASAGRVRLEQLLAGELLPELRPRVERERARVAAWIEARDAFLTARLESKKELELPLGEKRGKVRVARDTVGALVLDPGRGEKPIAIEAIDPLVLAQQMEAERGWIRFYPYVLGNDERWKKLLKNDPPEARALREDAADLPDRLRTGELAEWLDEIAARPTPGTAMDAELWLDEIATAPKRWGGLGLLERKQSALEALAAEVAEYAFDLAAPWKFLRGHVEPLGETVRVTYEFDDPAELEDFEAAPYVENYGREPLGDEFTHALRVEEGELRGTGQACLRSYLDFAAPLSVRYGLALEIPCNDSWLNVGLCDDGREHFAWALDFSNLQVWSEKERVAAHDKTPKPYDGRMCAEELSHDGKKVTLSCGGVVQQTLPCALREGAVFLWMHSSSGVRLDRLVIEGKLGAKPPVRLRAAWLARRLAELFPRPSPPK